MIAVVTDSASQMPPSLARQLGVTVVPVTVTIDGVDRLEGVELSAEAFYRQLAAAEVPPTIATSQPSAAAFVEVFEKQISAGASAILAILVGSAYSGAVNSAQVAAEIVRGRHGEVTVEVVDAGTASFGIACAVWAAANAVASGADLATARVAAEERAAVTGSVFILDGTDFARRSGRFGSVDLDVGIPVLASDASGLSSLGEVVSIEHGVDLMAERLLACSPRVVAAVGRASLATDAVTDALMERLRASSGVVDLIEYRVGPSIAAHTGPDTVGGFSFPA